MAKRETIISVALPKVALSRPPIVELVCMAICSVTKPRRSARGQSARRAVTNVIDWPSSNACPINDTGMQSSSTLSFVPNSSSRSELLM